MINKCILFLLPLDTRPTVKQYPELTPMVFGLSECQTIPYKKDSDLTLTCAARGKLFCHHGFTVFLF